MSNPTESLREKPTFNYGPLLRTEVKGQLEMARGGSLK